MKKLAIAVVTLAAAGSASAADMALKAPAALPAPASILPTSGFFLGLGGSYNSNNFGTQDVFAVGTSSVVDQSGNLKSTGSAAGPGSIYMGSASSAFAPSVQAGYFQRFFGSSWLWGARFTYRNLDASATVDNVLLPQAGSTTQYPNGPTTPFTGTAVARSYRTTIDHQLAFVPFIGQSFERSFIYIGAGPTLSHLRTNVNGLVGFANIFGFPSDVSGSPTDFVGSGWVFGGTAMVGATYFFSSSWFLDVNYSCAMTGNKTFNYSSPFTNPNGLAGTTITGTLVGNSTGNVITQGVMATLNMIF
jgi:opacity protein-like surface antigen